MEFSHQSQLCLLKDISYPAILPLCVFKSLVKGKRVTARQATTVATDGFKSETSIGRWLIHEVNLGEPRGNVSQSQWKKEIWAREGGASKKWARAQVIHKRERSGDRRVRGFRKVMIEKSWKSKDARGENLGWGDKRKWEIGKARGELKRKKNDARDADQRKR